MFRDSSFLGFFFFLVVDDLKSFLGIVSSILVCSNKFLEVVVFVRIRLDELKDSGVDLNIFELFNDSQLDGHSLTECETLRALQSEHRNVVILVFFGEFARNCRFSDLQGN